MTTEVQTPYTSTIANGSTLSFPYNFRVFSADDLKVSLDDVEVTSGFTVTGVANANGGTVDWPSNLTADTKVLIERRTVPKRDINYPAVGEIRRDTLNQDFDNIWDGFQYLLQLFKTAIRLPFDTTPEPQITQDATSRASKYVGFDAAGAVTLADIPDLAATQAAQAAAETAAATISGFENMGGWVTATSYAVNNLVLESGSTYICLVAHTSGTFADDLAASKWQVFAQKGTAGAGSGDVIAANNFSEYSGTLAAARAGLGLGSAAVVNTGTAAGAVPLNSDILGKHTIWIPAGAMKPQTTQGAASGVVETTTNNVMIQTLDFDYSTQIEFAQFAVRMPKSWNAGAVQAQFVWSCAAGATAFGVVWAIQARAFADTEALDQVWGTAVTVTDTASSTGDLIRTSDVTADITPSGTPAKEEIVIFRVYRIFNDAADTLDKDARLHGVTLFYTVDALNDA